MDVDEVERVMEVLRDKLKKRGAQGIRGLARNFKICDRDGSRSLDVQEFSKCCSMCKLGLALDEVRTLFAFFDKGGDGTINFDEFLMAVRGRLSPTRRKLVVKVFNALDAAGDGNGYLTIEDLHDAYSASDHPDVKAGKRTEQEVLTDLLEGFEGAGKGGNSKKGDGMVTLDEWIAYYEEVSSSIDTDDYFGVMITKCWSCLKTLAPDGKTLVPAISYVPAYEINTLEKILRKSIYQKAKKGASESRTVEEAFKQFDTDKSGKVSFPEFRKAMERFGLHVGGVTPGEGGVPPEVLQGLFDRYDADASGELAYAEFSRGLFVDDAQAREKHGNGGVNPLLPSISPTRAGTARGFDGGESLHATRPNSAYTRGRSMANPAPPRDPDAFKRSSGIFR
tara:strand:+ start:62 stop:1243 length:1182 start_codon:yes stop_codon:yes gene_type:complete